MGSRAESAGLTSLSRVWDGPRRGGTTARGGDWATLLPARARDQADSPAWPPAATAPPASGRAPGRGPRCRRSGRPLQARSGDRRAPPPWRLGVTWPRVRAARRSGPGGGAQGAEGRVSPKASRAGRSREGGIGWEGPCGSPRLTAWNLLD